MSDHLPPDVFMDIMTRLPVDTILRCTSVSKLWYSLITSPTFISIHLNESIAKSINNPKLLLRHCWKDHSKEPYDFSTERKYTYITEKYTIHSDDLSFDALCTNFTIPFDKSMSYYSIIGMSNGLLCLVDKISGTDRIFLWNPHIRKVLQVPTPPSYDYPNYRYNLGFGFTPLTNDYKIVRVMHMQMDLFEVNTGSWRRISEDNWLFTINWRYPQAFFDGVVHWVGYNRATRDPMIGSFDMENEVFGEMGMPVGVKDSELNCRVAVYGDSLSLLEPLQSDNGDCCYIWVMKEYGNPESWTKQFTIDLEQGRFRTPFGFQGNGNVLMATDRGDVVSYDPSTRQKKSLGINGYVNYEVESNIFFAGKYVESLVLLGKENVFTQAAFVPEEENDLTTKLCNEIEEITITRKGSS